MGLLYLYILPSIVYVTLSVHPSQYTDDVAVYFGYWSNVTIRWLQISITVCQTEFWKTDFPFLQQNHSAYVWQRLMRLTSPKLLFKISVLPFVQYVKFFLRYLFWEPNLGSLRFNPLKPELNPICYLLALLGAHHFLHVIG